MLTTIRTKRRALITRDRSDFHELHARSRMRRAAKLLKPPQAEPPDGFVHRYSDIVSRACLRILGEWRRSTGRRWWQEAIRRRKEEKLTQREHAALASVSIPTIVGFDRGEKTLTLAKAFDILRVVGLIEEPGRGRRPGRVRSGGLRALA